MAQHLLNPQPSPLQACHDAPSGTGQDSSVAGSAGLIVLLVVLACGLLFWQLGRDPLFDVDEPRYAQTAQEMLQRHDWITPYFNGKVRFDKPVFFYWLIAFSYQCLGVSEWSARLVSGLATVGTATGIWWACRGVATTMAPLFTLVFVTCLLVFGIGRMSITDMTLTLWMTLTTLTAYRATAPRHQRLWLLAGVFAGLGILTKGPVALALPGLVVLLTTVYQRQFKATFARVWPWAGALLGVAIALPWYWACYQANGWPFIDALLLHNVSRFEGVVSGHDQPWFFYALVLFAGCFPWTAFLPQAMKTAWQNRRSQLPLDQLAQFGLIWLVTVFVFFQVAQTKLLTYILPLFPAVGILVGYHWHRASQPSLLLGLRMTLVVTAVLVLTMGILGLDRFLPHEASGTGINNAVWWVGLALGFGLLAGERLMAANKRPYSVAAVAAGWLAAVAIAINGLLPAISQVAHAPVREVRQYIARHGDHPVITYRMQRTSLTYYLNKPIAALTTPAELSKQLNALPAGQTALVLTKKRFFDDVVKTHPVCGVVRQTPVYVLFSCH